MKKIVFVTGSMVRGGAEGVIATLANCLSKKGWKVYIISILFDICDYPLDKSISYINLSNQKRNQLLDTPRLVLSLRREIRKIRPEAVLSFMVAVNIVTWCATRWLNTKYIPSERNDPRGRNIATRILQHVSYSSANKVVFQTTRAKDYFSRRIQKKGIIIPNPLKEMPKFSSNKRKVIVTAGRLSEQKNHMLLIDVFERIYKDFPDFKANIYGEGNLKGILQAYISNRGLTDIVSLCGKIDNVPEAIRDAYMFVLPSNFEGMSNALLEAMGVGVPCISTNCAGSDDIIENGYNGLIVPIRDRISMEKAIRYLINNPDKALNMGINARNSMEKFKECNIIKQWETIID